MLIWQRQCRLPRLCYVYTRGMNYYIHVPRYVNRVARNKSHRVTVRVFGLKLFCNKSHATSCVVCHGLTAARLLSDPTARAINNTAQEKIFPLHNGSDCLSLCSDSEKQEQVTPVYFEF